MSQCSALRTVLYWLCAALFVAGISACATTGPGEIITDTGKARADREKRARDTRPIMRENRAASASGSEVATTAATTSPDVNSAPEAAGEDVAAPTVPLVADAGGALAVLVDVVRPAAAGATGASADDYVPVADDELGLVQVQRGGASVSVQRGMALALGDEVATAAGSVAILNYPPNIEIYVMPSTQIRIGSIFVKLGEIWVSIKGKLKEKFKVETEFVTAGVEGTEFLFRADSAGTVDVDVMKGAVVCTSKLGRWAPIRMMRMQKFSARRDNVAPLTRTLVASDIALVRARVKPVSVAVATKLRTRTVIPVSKQLYTVKPADAKQPYPAARPTPDDKARSPGDTQIKPELKNLPGRTNVITKPPLSVSPTDPSIKTLPKVDVPITRPPANQSPNSMEFKTLPKLNTQTIKQPSTTLPNTVTTPLKTLPKNTDLMTPQ
jgi:hypothetical protein